MILEVFSNLNDSMIHFTVHCKTNGLQTCKRHRCCAHPGAAIPMGSSGARRETLHVAGEQNELLPARDSPCARSNGG